MRARLYQLGADIPVAEATFDAGTVTVVCDDPDLKLRLTTYLDLPVRTAETLEEIDEELEPGTEEHFRAALSAEAHLGLRVAFDNG